MNNFTLNTNLENEKILQVLKNPPPNFLPVACNTKGDFQSFFL